MLLNGIVVSIDGVIYSIIFYSLYMRAIYKKFKLYISLINCQ